MGNLQDGRIDWGDLVFTDDEAEIAKYLLRRGDVLFNRTNTIDLVGKCSLFDDRRRAIFAGYLIRISVAAERLDARYLNYVLNTEFSRRHSQVVLSVAVGQANINAEKVKTYPIPVPPTVDEQRAIAAALSDADALLDGLDRLIAKRRDLKRATLQQLLTGRTRLPRFAGEWGTKRMVQIADVRSGGTPSTARADFWGGDIPWCTPTDITALGGRKYLATTEHTISTAGLRESAAELIPTPSVIMTSRATIGECAINTVPMATNQGFKNLVPTAVDCEFLYYLMTMQKDRLTELCGGSTFLEIGKRELNRFELRLPPSREEQRAIATVLADMDAELDALARRRAKTADLKRAMMQALLTGRVRLADVKVQDDSAEK